MSDKAPNYIYTTSALWWKLVDDLIKIHIPKKDASYIINGFFKQFKPLPRDQIQSPTPKVKTR